ncbi:PQQ-dependent sugar dehydrogenase [Botrimarina mediterranea]|nr:PQQ-dependent sugar dehydrogenase [Botrimarina mediterranea]
MRTSSIGLAMLLAATCSMTVQAATYHVSRLTGDLHIPVDAEVVPGFEDKIFIAQLGGVASDGTDGDPITKSEGRIVVYDRNTGAVDYDNPFLVINDTSLVDPYGVPEVGLFSMAFHPEFQTNGKLYVNAAVNHTGPAPTVDSRVSPFKTVVREYTVDVNNPALPVTGSRTILTLDQPAANHNGSWIGFNPHESAQGIHNLYITQGDGGDQHDPFNYAQNPNNWYGTVMRVDVDGDDFAGDADKNYAIPADNPYADGVDGAPEVWAWGLRNPWRASFDSANGDMYIGDVGQGWYEEVNLIPAGTSGQNFGWRLREGTVATPTGGVGGPSRSAVDPIYAYLHFGRPGANPDFAGNSVTGGVLYRGPIQELDGRYIFADNVFGQIWSFDPANPLGTVQNMNSLFTPDEGQIFGVTSFDLDENGNLLIVDGAGGLYTLLANAALTLTVNRETGEMTFNNFTGDPAAIKSYQLTSSVGAIGVTELTPVTGNYDASPGGDGSIDATGDWQILSGPSDPFVFEEGAIGAAPTFADQQGFQLSAAGGWIPSPNEDLVLTVTLGDGTVVPASVEYIGNDGVPYVAGDIDFDGEVSFSDWVVFNDNHLTDIAGMSPAASYGHGDLDGDGDNDFDDFRLFQQLFDSANGAGAFAKAIGVVPEPSSLLIGSVAILAVVSRPQRRVSFDGLLA